jgi:hypothetical protein
MYLPSFDPQEGRRMSTFIATRTAQQELGQLRNQAYRRQRRLKAVADIVELVFFSGFSPFLFIIGLGTGLGFCSSYVNSPNWTLWLAIPIGGAVIILWVLALLLMWWAGHRESLVQRPVESYRQKLLATGEAVLVDDATHEAWLRALTAVGLSERNPLADAGRHTRFLREMTQHQASARNLLVDADGRQQWQAAFEARMRAQAATILEAARAVEQNMIDHLAADGRTADH